MAITLGDAIVFIRGDKSKLGKDLDGAEKQTKGWASKMGGAVSGLVGGVVVAGAAAAGAAIVGIGAAALNVASDARQAQKNLQAELGLTEADAARLGQVAVDVFGNNFAGSVQEAASVVGEARKQLGAMADGELQRVTESAFALSDVFGVDTTESLNAVSTLMDEFGMTSSEAFDFITTGFQKGLNNSDDFLDSIGEYSNLFNDAGFDADQFFSIMETGAKGGVLGTDKISDAIKEMGIILGEGGDDAKMAFEQIGLDFDQVAASVAEGDETWADYFGNIVDGLNGIEDPIERQKAQVAIFGTMAEDLGVSFTEGLSKASTSMEDMAGATDGLGVKYESLGQIVAAGKRKFLVALQPIGDKLLDLAMNLMPLVVTAFDWFGAQLPTIIAVGEQALAALWDLLMEFGPGILEVVSFFSPLVMLFQVIRGDFDEQLGPILAWFQEMLPLALQMAAEFFTGVLVPAFQQASAFVTETLIPNFMAFVEFLQGVFQVVVAEVGAFLMEMFGIVVAWVQENWPLIQETVATVLAAVQAVVEAVLTAIVTFWDANGAAILAKVTMVWETVKAVVEAGIRTVLTVVKAVMLFITQGWGAGWAEIQGIVDLWKPAVEMIISTAMDLIKTAISLAIDAIKVLWQVGWDAVKTIAQTVWDALPGIIDAAIGLIKSGINSGLKAARDIVQFVMDSIKDKVTEAWNAIPGLFETGINTAKGFITGAVGAFRAAGAAVVDAIKEGISNAWGSLVGWFDGKLQELKDKLPFSEPKKPSPLRGLGKAGEAYVGNILAGMERAMPRLQEAVNGMLGGMAGGAMGAGAGGDGNTQFVFNYGGQRLDEGQVRRDIRMTQQLTRGA